MCQRAGLVEDHHIDIGKRGDVGEAIAAVGHQRNLRGEPVFAIFVEIDQRGLVEVEHNGIEKLGHRTANLNAG